MDKKRGTSVDAAQETDKQFLDRTGVTEQMQECLTKVLQNRPEDPIEFLADYFETLGDKNDRVTKAYEQVKLTHYTKDAFKTNVRIAYDLLGQTKGGRQLKGVTGNTYSELLTMLTSDFPMSIREKLWKKIHCRDFEVVVFDVFKSGIFTCLVLQDFLHQSRALFTSLDTSKSGAIDKVLGDIITQQLGKAVSTFDSAKPASVLEGVHILAPDKLYASIATAMYNTKASSNKPLITEDDFVAAAADTFLSKVETLR